jgi:ubiquinone/menaquinone biosynthesis C-methylase UbiE
MGAVDLTQLFAVPTHHLGAKNPALQGIFSPEGETGDTTGVTDQFLANAAEYHRRYSDVGHFRHLIDRAVDALDVRDPALILDIGSGSGNSVIPMLDRFPRAFVLATDISPQLLAILRDYLEAKPQYTGRYALVCMDATHDPYRPGVFDLAVGAAILHHLIEPQRVVKVCERALKPGGAAIFFEPFEPGLGLMRIAYREILAEASRRGESSPGIEHLVRVATDYDARSRDKSDPIFRRLDDKWMFTRGLFESATSNAAWNGARFEPVNPGPQPLTDQTRTNIRLGIGADESALPAWAWTMLREYETTFSPAAQRELMLEGIVMLRRSG